MLAKDSLPVVQLEAMYNIILVPVLQVVFLERYALDNKQFSFWPFQFSISKCPISCTSASYYLIAINADLQSQTSNNYS